MLLLSVVAEGERNKRMNHISGSFCLQSGILIDQSFGAGSYEDAGLVIRWLGRLSGSFGDPDPGLKIAEAFHNDKEPVTEQLGGLYLAFVYDKNAKALCFYHGMSTFPLALYYTTNAGHLYFSTSLKILLGHSGIRRQFDTDGLLGFLAHGHVTGSRTLVRDVNKMEPFKSLCVRDGIVKQIPVRYGMAVIGEEEAMACWDAVLKRAVCRTFANEQEVNLAISSGFDSNYILYVSSQETSGPINAFSIGAQRGRSELPLVRKNVAGYERVSLFTACTGPSSLLCLPDIIWRLEGAVYERGIFLQYELARLVRDSGKTFLVCGEGADQVMNMWFLDQERMKGPGAGTPLSSREFPYLFGTNMVLKKNGILANSFDIDTRYPFLDDEFVTIAQSLRSLNGTNKQFHKDHCAQVLPRRIMENISKIGGATDVHSLFGSEAEIARFKAGIRKTPFYRNHAPEKTFRQFTVALFNKLLDMTGKNAQEVIYKRKELSLRQFVGYAYLIMFDELLLSGKYDSLFQSQSMDRRLSDFLPALF